MNAYVSVARAPRDPLAWALLVLAAALALGPAAVAQAAGFKSVTAGGFHSCAVRGDDTLVCWGGNQFGQASPPAGSFKSVSAGK